MSQMPGFTPRVEVSGNFLGQTRFCKLTKVRDTAGKLTKSLFERQLFAIANGSIFPPRHLGPGNLEDPGATIDIDFIEYSDLERTLRAVRSQLQPGCSVSMEFTAIEAHVTFLSDEFILCAIPFLTPKQIRPSSARRTTTPLLVSLHRITEYLTTGTSSTSIETITNATSERITALRLLHKNLLTDRALRSALIRNLEEQGWREHRFMVSWEAELLAAGLLSRWAIVIRKLFFLVPAITIAAVCEPVVLNPIDSLNSLHFVPIIY
ncbi:hypothetical protein Hypma_011805 [Hypsizygus marmoreus]|uniref:Uncharacterized protein n=1 Tax=Hypsizygus marmoreus TaxID=39966 RepID=A0A369JQK7_HYPMA|nr:hypothetical protein Hypma_011805 [Hypsizygus marmoreus]